MESIIVKEYTKKQITDCNLTKLQNYLECQNLHAALTVTPDGIKTKSWVGVIKYKNLHLEILPKLISENANDDNELIDITEQNNILKNLIYMLSYTKKLDIKTSDYAKLAKQKNPFIEILIKEYATSLFNCLKRLTPQQYIREENNLNYIKGKIKISQNICYNSCNLTKFYCEYNEYSENNILNRLFLFTSVCLYNISNNSYNKKILKFIINYYSDIDLIKFDKFNVKKIKLARNQELFKKPFNFAKMFIEQTNVDLSKNKFENITLVWDMNKLFEEFIYCFIKKNIPDCNAKFQINKKLLKTYTGKRRNTKVDIFINKPKIIIDTKYKKFTCFDDISSNDIYQVMSYCTLHNVNKAILLYPQWGENKPELPEYYLNNDKKNIKINFKTINLKYENLQAQTERIKSEIEQILFPKKDVGEANNKS